MSKNVEGISTADPGTVLHWYDFLCPFCYVGQHRTGILVRHGLDVIELPFQAHPEIPAGGATAGPRAGPMYEMLERAAARSCVALALACAFAGHTTRLGHRRMGSAA